MLLVRVRVEYSPIHGLGVFALEAISKGRVVWRFTPGFDLDLDPALVAAQPEPFRERLLHYGYVDSRLHRYILCCDDARFLNHSEKPNLLPDFSTDPYGIDRAARDIAVGEELTVNYELVEGKVPGCDAGTDSDVPLAREKSADAKPRVLGHSPEKGQLAIGDR